MRASLTASLHSLEGRRETGGRVGGWRRREGWVEERGGVSGWVVERGGVGGWRGEGWEITNWHCYTAHDEPPMAIYGTRQNETALHHITCIC